MIRRTTLLLMGAVLASLIGVPQGASAGHNCTSGVNFLYCGEHPRFGALPLEFRINLESRPNNLSRSDVVGAASAAIGEWNRYWPIPSGNVLCPALCLSSTPTSVVGAQKDGKSTISWASNFGSCGGGHAGVAVACIWYEGTDGAPGHRIAEVDIILSKAKSWYQPALVDTASPDRSHPVESAAGEATVLYPELGENNAYDLIGGGRGKYDVQSAITHELGHALGLEDIGDESIPYPGSSDAFEYSQTMYRWYYRGTTFKRSLGEGDLSGLTVVATQTLIDGG